MKEGEEVADIQRYEWRLKARVRRTDGATFAQGDELLIENHQTPSSSFPIRVISVV